MGALCSSQWSRLSFRVLCCGEKSCGWRFFSLVKLKVSPLAPFPL